MNGKMVGTKPLYVALAQRKEERRARLQVSYLYSCPSLAKLYVIFEVFLVLNVRGIKPDLKMVLIL